MSYLHGLHPLSPNKTASCFLFHALSTNQLLVQEAAYDPHFKDEEAPNLIVKTRVAIQLCVS